ncbi:MAG: hypothetical protein J6J79_06300 [Lachnospiraceae bacterium]|nr:hypothetical protein [Lachnospiraceae bacterium]
MKKDFHFDKENELFEEQLSEEELNKAKILIKVIPFILIILILMVTLVYSAVTSKNAVSENEKLQESIKEYADSNKADKEISASVIETPKPIISEDINKMQETASPAPTSTIAPTLSPSEEEEIDFSSVSFDADAHLSEMMSYWEENNVEALNELAHLKHYRAMSYSLKGSDEFYYYGETNAKNMPQGKGIAVYADNQYYYGEWQNGVRCGKGTWMHYHIYDKVSTTDLYIFHQYAGMWRDDLPNGEGSEHYDLNETVMRGNGGYNTNLVGTYLNGMINGDFYLTNLYCDGNVKEWTAKASEGSWIYCADSKDKEGRMPVQQDIKDDGNYIWLHPSKNINIGVPCLISKNKN